MGIHSSCSRRPAKSAEQPVLLTHRRGLGEHARGLLERRGREERVGRKACLRDSEQHGLRRGGLAARGDRPRVDVLELEAVEELHRQELGVPRLLDAHLAQHLADDDLDVLVVDRHTLAVVDALDLIDHVAVHGLAA